MIAILNFLVFDRVDYIGRTVQIFSDGEILISFLLHSFWKYSLSDTKSRLCAAYRRACQFTYISFFYVEGHSGIWQN